MSCTQLYDVIWYNKSFKISCPHRLLLKRHIFHETPQLCIVFLIYKVVFKITLLKKKNISQVMTKDLAGIGKTIRIPFHITHLPSQFDMVQETKEICFGRWERFETYFYEANRPTL